MYYLIRLDNSVRQILHCTTDKEKAERFEAAHNKAARQKIENMAPYAPTVSIQPVKETPE